MAIASGPPRQLHSLSTRLLLTYLTLMVIGLGGLIAWTGQQLATQRIAQSGRELTLQAQIIANGVRDPFEHVQEGEGLGGRSLDSLLASYGENTGARVTLTDSSLRVVDSSDARVPVASVAGPEFSAASAGSNSYSIRWDDVRREERLFVAAPIRDDHGRVLAFIQLSTPMLPIYASIGQTWLSLIGIGLVVLFLTILASIVLARQIAVPVLALTRTTERIAGGDLEGRVTPSGPDEIRRLGLAFNRMAERVQETWARQRAFVDNAAHELRSPLTALRLRLEMLQAHGESDVELSRRYLNQMEREIGYLQRLVDHLLSLASLEGSEPASRVPLEPARLLQELAEDMGILAQRAGLALMVEAPDSLPCIEVNPEQIRMALRNLFDNAIKASPPAGSITLRGQVVGPEVALSVQDNGIGIPPGALPHVFERFYRVDPARSRQQGGAGLGLSLVQAIAVGNGGRVDVKSKPGEGSLFTIYLPIKNADPK